MRELTNAEEQVMHYLWKLKKAFLKDIVEQFPEPRPAYTTISTVIRVLVKKGFIAYNTYGKTHEYYPAVAKDSYFQSHFSDMVKSFFNGSLSKFASFFTRANDLNICELEKMKQLIDQRIDELRDEHE